MATNECRKYLSQRDDNSCGPIAIVNACKWASETSINGSEWLKHIKAICGTTKTIKDKYGGVSKQGGTTLDGLKKGVVSCGHLFSSQYKIAPSIKDIKKHLALDGAVLLCYKTGRMGHATFIDKKGNDYYRTINVGSKIHWFKNTELRNILQRKKQGRRVAVAWFLTRR